LGAQTHDADLILVDVGPNLGAINRSALIGSDFVLFPLGADMFSLQGLRNLGPSLRRWREDWNKRLENWERHEFELPTGTMLPIGYVVNQPGIRLSRPVKAYDRWVNRIPAEYEISILSHDRGSFPTQPSEDPNCLATLKHFRSLMALSQEARKPVFHLTSADGAIGNHSLAVREAHQDFKQLAEDILHIVEKEKGVPLGI
jgi:cellulose biosynthesis protein BcsQ